MKLSFSSFSVGFIFSLGLGLSGMTQPQKVVGFLDIANWDPSLIFVMIGAISVHAFLYPLVRKRSSPLLDTKWHVPDRKDLTPQLLLGSALFGIGWGLAGYCPGPALTSLASGQSSSFVFIAMMLLGMFIYTKVEKFIPLKK